MRTLTFALLVLCSLSAIAQSHTISGYIKDAASDESLIGATVQDALSGKGGTANVYGFFSLTLDADSAKLLFSYVGYRLKSVVMLLTIDTAITIRLEGLVLLDEVVVESSRVEKIQESSRTGTISVPVTQIKKVPAFMGETDVIKVLQLLPGVQGGNEGSSGLYVRGGGPDQNLILLDGVPVYNPSHLFGLFSTFNSDAINHVELVKGGFPARYGGRLSSVVDISMKEGNQQKFQATGTVGVVSAKLALEGPIIKERTSFIVSGRTSYLNLLNNVIVPKPIGTPTDDYHFYDLNLKVNHQVNAQNRIYLSGYLGADNAETHTSMDFNTDDRKYHDTRVSGMNWGNKLLSARWNHMYGKRLFSTLATSYSQYKLEIGNEWLSTIEDLQTGLIDSSFYSNRYSSGIRDYMARLDFEYIPNPRHYIRFGTQFTNHEFRPGANAQSSSEVIADSIYVNRTVIGNEGQVFIEDDWELSRRLKANVGLHASSFMVGENVFYSLQPRLSARYLVSDELALKGSFSTMQQYIHLLTHSGLGLPTDLWVPATSVVPPQYAWQTTFSAARTVAKSFEVSIEAFYKSMNNVVEYRDGATYTDTKTDWQGKVESGRGRSYGGEFFIQKKYGNWSGWIGYTLSWSERKFEVINEGEWFPYRYDRRHDIKITTSYAVGRYMEFGATWLFATGNAITVPTDAHSPVDNYYYHPPHQILYFPSRNNFRMSNYHRLDLNATFRVNWRSSQHSLTASVYNAYGRQNPLYYEFVYTPQGRALMQKSLFPFIPSISYSIKL